MPIPGTRTLERLKDNPGATDLTLTDAELRELNAALDRIPLSGARYPEALEKRTGL